MAENLTLKVMLALPKGVSVTECKRSVIIHAGVNHALMDMEVGHLCLSNECVSLMKNKKNHPLRGRLTEDFMISRHEVINIGKITSLESHILKGIVIYLILHGIPISSQVVLKIFQIMHFLCMQCKYIEFPHL